MPIFGETIGLLDRGLDYASARHSLLANNIANSETPGFKRSDMTFHDYYQERIPRTTSLTRTHRRHIPGMMVATSPRLLHGNTNWRNDKNNVDIDAEMAYLSQNTIHYNHLSRQMQDNLGRLDLVIRKGGQ